MPEKEETYEDLKKRADESEAWKLIALFLLGVQKEY